MSNSELKPDLVVLGSDCKTILEKKSSFMLFRRYHSIENAHRKGLIDNISIYAPKDVEWIALEKIHGANFSATTDGITTKWGKRSSYICGSGLQIFNNSNIIAEKYTNSMLQLFRSVQEYMLGMGHTKPTYVIVYGEICGGKYQGYTSKFRHVQKQVQYTHDIEFVVYDICVITDIDTLACEETNSSSTTHSDTNIADYNQSDEKVEIDDNNQNDEEDTESYHANDDNSPPYGHRSVFLDMELVIQFCNNANVPVTPILHSGTLQTLLNLNTQFQTLIPSLFGLPGIDGNYAEGYVLKLRYENKFSSKNRMIIKLKNPNFAEAHHKEKKIIIKAEGENELNETNLNILNELKYYITENRKNSVLSKLDDLQKRNTKMVLGLVVKDAFTDFQKDNPNVITQETRSLFTKKLFNYTANYFLVGEVEK
jgi:hypothetical protein